MTRVQSDQAVAFLFYWKAHAPMGAPLPIDEFEFDRHLKRRHRFDFAWPYKKVAVEVNGNAWHTKGGGRHGKDDDLEKMNLAVSLGWKVFQFSPKMLKDDPAACVDMVVKALRLEKAP